MVTFKQVTLNAAAYEKTLFEPVVKKLYYARYIDNYVKDAKGVFATIRAWFASMGNTIWWYTGAQCRIGLGCTTAERAFFYKENPTIRKVEKNLHKVLYFCKELALSIRANEELCKAALKKAGAEYFTAVSERYAQTFFTGVTIDTITKAAVMAIESATTAYNKQFVDLNKTAPHKSFEIGTDTLAWLFSQTIPQFHKDSCKKVKNALIVLVTPTFIERNSFDLFITYMNTLKQTFSLPNSAGREMGKQVLSGIRKKYGKDFDRAYENAKKRAALKPGVIELHQKIELAQTKVHKLEEQLKKKANQTEYANLLRFIEDCLNEEKGLAQPFLTLENEIATAESACIHAHKALQQAQGALEETTKKLDEEIEVINASTRTLLTQLNTLVTELPKEVVTKAEVGVKELTQSAKKASSLVKAQKEHAEKQAAVDVAQKKVGALKQKHKELFDITDEIFQHKKNIADLTKQLNKQEQQISKETQTLLRRWSYFSDKTALNEEAFLREVFQDVIYAPDLVQQPTPQRLIDRSFSDLEPHKLDPQTLAFPFSNTQNFAPNSLPKSRSHRRRNSLNPSLKFNASTNYRTDHKYSADGVSTSFTTESATDTSPITLFRGLTSTNLLSSPLPSSSTFSSIPSTTTAIASGSRSTSSSSSSSSINSSLLNSSPFSSIPSTTTAIASGSRSTSSSSSNSSINSSLLSSSPFSSTPSTTTAIASGSSSTSSFSSNSSINSSLLSSSTYSSIPSAATDIALGITSTSSFSSSSSINSSLLSSSTSSSSNSVLTTQNIQVLNYQIELEENNDDKAEEPDSINTSTNNTSNTEVEVTEEVESEVEEAEVEEPDEEEADEEEIEQTGKDKIVKKDEGEDLNQAVN